jgi:hypothetical protein
MEEKDMRKFTKSIIAFAIAMVLTLGWHSGITAFAADNSSSASAQAITLNSAVTDSLVDGDDANWYKFEIKEAGYFEVNMGLGSSNADDVKYGWDLVVYDSSCQNEIQKATNIKGTYIGAKRAFEPGTYYIKITADFSLSAPSCSYDLKVTFTGDSNWESESNDGSNTADTIAENTMIKGSLYKSSDIDWYKVSISTKGYFNVILALDGSSNADDVSYGWDMNVYDSSFNEIQKISGVRGNNTCANRAYAPGTYYIKISANFSLSAPIDCIYNLTVKTTESNLWESEDNDSSAKADTVELNKTYHGLLHSSSDVDWYKVKVTGSGKLTVTLKKPDSTNIDDVKYGWNLELCKSTGDALAKTTEINNSGKVALSNLKKGTYYVKVTANFSLSAPIDCEYTLKATFTEGLSKVSLKSATAGKKQVKLSWKKVSGATGYYVYRSTSKSGKYTKIATIKKGSTVTYTNKNLKSKQTYYYKVIAYKTANGKTTTGTASAVKSAKTK